jgi:hypothetical protein
VQKENRAKRIDMADLLQTIERYRQLGIEEQIDYKKFYLYSIITHSTALSIDTENENYLVGPYEEIPNKRKPVIGK